MQLHKIIEEIIHTEIPLSTQMGISIESFNGDEIVVKAPLAPNINHKNTAFGGSLYNVSVLTGWAMVYGILLRKNIKAHVVIQHSEIDYSMAIQSDIIGKCKMPSKEVVEKFISTFQKRGRSRILLDVEIKNENQIAVSFSGKYVIHR